MSAPVQLDPVRRDFYEDIGRSNLAPLWEKIKVLVPREPTPTCVPCHWRYEQLRQHLMRAGSLISAHEAERRVLVLENPGRRGDSCVTNTLYAGVQLLLSAETARSHRHTQSALRFIIEGDGAFTAVEGEKLFMQPGDLILTPSWTWHEHGNPTQAPIVWLDVLDVPLVQTLDAGFFESFDASTQLPIRAEGEAHARFGMNLLPVEYRLTGHASPVFAYPYERTRAALDTLARNSDIDAALGIRMKYVNPTTGDYALPTISSFIQLLPRDFSGTGHRSTDSTLYLVVEGQGRTRIGEHTFEWKPHDVFVAPSWSTLTHEVLGSDAVLFSCSDRGVQEKLGLWREQRSARSHLISRMAQVSDE